MVQTDQFREDLLYRLQVISLHIPPLRERREDIIPIGLRFVADFATRHGRPVRELSGAARRAMVAYDWPGNVRELRNAIERAVVLAEGGVLDVGDLPLQVSGAAAPLRPTDAALADAPFADARDRAVDAWERAFLAAALERHGGNVSRTARALDLHRQSLQKKLRQLGLARE